MEYKDEQLEAMLERLMRDEAIEIPSADFTDKVMGQVRALSTGLHFTYQPLISKRGWLLIAFLFTLLVAYVLMNSTGEGHEWLSHLKGLDLQFQLFENIDFEFSKTLTYSFILFGIMLLVQATVLKSYFNKRLSV